MNDPIDIALIGAIAGLISGALASLIAPWIQWGIEKRKSQHNDRRNLIKKVRELVIDVSNEQERINELIAANPSELPKELKYPKAITYLDALQRHQHFHAIKQFLNESIIESLSNSHLYKLEDRGTILGQLARPFCLLLNDISKLEKKWKLI